MNWVLDSIWILLKIIEVLSLCLKSYFLEMHTEYVEVNITSIIYFKTIKNILRHGETLTTLKSRK